jgi:hypothetical protein
LIEILGRSFFEIILRAGEDVKGRACAPLEDGESP